MSQASIQIKPLFFLWLLLNVLSVFVCRVAATGKGTIDVYAINDSYAAVTDSNFDAILILDLIRGGIAGQLILHDVDASSSEWTNPTGVSSCDVCPFLILTSTKGDHMYKVMLPNNTTLLEMSSMKNFSTFSDSIMVPYWPWEDFGINGKIRMVTMKRDGSMGYVAHFNYGLFSMDPLHGVHEHDKILLAANEIPGKHVSGLTLVKGENNLILTTPETATDYKLVINRTNGISEVEQQDSIDLTEACKTGEYTMHFRDTIYLPELDSWISVGHKGGHDDNRGMALYNISYNGTDHERFKCDPFAGDDLTRPGWVDGSRTDVRFSRPHSMTMTPTSKELLITDIDNRALRKVNLDAKSDRFGQVSTVSYDEDNLWTLMYDDESSIASYEPRLYPVFKSHGDTSQGKQEHIMNYFDAEHYCLQNHHGQLCSLSTIRQNLPSFFHQHNKKQSANEIVSWTNQRCHSCWLHYPGQCEPPASRLESAAKRGDSSWGSTVFMVSTLREDGSIETQCKEGKTKISGMPICCAHQSTLTTLDDVTNIKSESSLNWYDNNLTTQLMLIAFFGVLLATVGVRILKQKTRAQQHRSTKTNIKTLEIEEKQSLEII